jgi:hypothetical protein
MSNRIVVWDPNEEFLEGALIDRQRENILNARGGVALPVDPGLFKLSGVGGYMRRGWGSGWPLDHHQPRMCCPLTMFLPMTHRHINWVVRLIPAPAHAEAAANGETFGEGQLRLVGDSAQSHATAISVTPGDGGMDVRALGKTDAHGGWTYKGRALAHPAADTHYAFSLYGMAPGLRVAWAAITATEEIGEQ